MKKILIITTRLLCLGGCFLNKKAETKPTDPSIFINERLGIKFTYSAEEWKGQLATQDNQIFYLSPENGITEYIALFTKNENETIEEAILRIVKEKGYDSTKCRVVDRGAYWGNPSYEEYILDLANPNIVYTEEELEKIEEANVTATQEGGPFNGEWKKKEIYNQRLVQACSEYAEPLGLGTCKTIGSKFIYNNQNKIVFLPGLNCSPSFYQEDSIELFE
jgi:hypothetical protein